MSTVFVQVRDRARGNVTAPMILWSMAMAVVLFMLQARLGHRTETEWAGVGVTALLGAYLGWKRRVAAAFIAPFVSWMVAWFPLVVASMIYYGFLKGLVVGIFWITVGWIFIAMAEFVWLFLVASFVRVLRGSSGGRGPDVMIFGPGGDSL